MKGRPVSMKALSFGLAAFVLFALAAAPARADTGSIANCVASYQAHFSPGLTLSNSQQTFTTTGGVLNCLGVLEGNLITGPGTINQIDGQIWGSCAAGNGSSTLVLAIPTSGPKYRARIPVTFSYVAGQGVKFGGPPLFGPYTFAQVPVAGTCLPGDPITESDVVGEFVLET